MADEKAETIATKPVIDLLTSILDEFKKQVQGNTLPPLEGKAVGAVAAFKEISAELEVKAA